MTTAERVASRFLQARAGKKHYRINRRRLKHLNDREKNLEMAREQGGYTKWHIEVVPISSIAVEKVWKPKRFENALEKMKDGVALDPINATKRGGKWHIEDGIHRTNASIEMGYTHIPVFVSEWVDTPELYEPPEPEKPELNVGDWVRMHKRYEGRHSFGWVAEKLGPRPVRGVKRYFYELQFVDKTGEDWTFGDFSDQDFEPAKAPSWGEKAKAKVEAEF